MSGGQVSRHLSLSTHSSNLSPQVRQTPPPTSLTPENRDAQWEPCAATACFFLYAQRNQILVLHHDTLTIERRFELHREDVLWIAVDNVSDRGSGRLAVSFDVGRTAIVWDILSGGEVARFSAYEHMRVATFMRNGNIAFANDQGNAILFEPSTSEHVSARTIFDPITAIAPAADCRTFAIGYLNGSILIATLQPSFTILHTLNTTRSPSRITDLAWHGSSSKQKTDMLATQTSDGDLRVWSVPKIAHGELPNIIRVLQRPDLQQRGPCWFAWSKNGRIVQYADGETRAWDVRTKKVTYDIIPTEEGVTGIAGYGPTATLFALGRNHAVYQYDINPSSVPMQVASVQHAPANTPPTPPTILEELRTPYAHQSSRMGAEMPPTFTDNGSSVAEGSTLSPLQKIAQELDSLDVLESEIRDKVMPLSPHSSKASSVSSKSSGRHSATGRQYLYDAADSSRASSTTGYEGTEFSFGPSIRLGHESMSSRPSPSLASAPNAHHTRRSSNLRREVLRSPQGSQDTTPSVDLFPSVRSRLKQVPFRTPNYGNVARTPDLLLSEMLSVVFGWNDEVRSLIRDEMAQHRPGSASAVLLAKWLGDMGADNMASMIGSESMTSSDWMLLALSSIGADSQKKVGEAFVQRLLEKGDVHPAVAILLGLGEYNDAIEVYVSQQSWMEAVLLAALATPSDWQRISFLIRKWGEAAVTQGQPELAVRCFSCTSVETSEPWFSPRAQDAVYASQQELFVQPQSAHGMTSPPVSPPSRSASGRLTAKNASLKLITSFGDQMTPLQTGKDAAITARQGDTAIGVTPIAQSALSPSGTAPWKLRRENREPSTARTATPGGYARRKRLPSRSEIDRAKQEAAEMATPLTAARDKGSRASELASRDTSTAEPNTTLRPGTGRDDNHLPSPAHGIFARFQEQSNSLNMSRDLKPEDLHIQIVDTAYTDALSPGPSTDASSRSRNGAFSPGPMTGGSTISGKNRAPGEYVNSVEEARAMAREGLVQSRKRNESRKRSDNRSGRARSRVRESSDSRGRGNVRYIRPSKLSPSSPVPMSPEEISQASGAQKAEPATTDDEDFYKAVVTSPTDSHRSAKSHRLRSSAEEVQPKRSANKTALISGLAPLTLGGERGRSQNREIEPSPRSPSLPTLSSRRFGERDLDVKAGRGFRLRARSSSRQRSVDLQSRRQASRGAGEPSESRRPNAARAEETRVEISDVSAPSTQEGESSPTKVPETRARTLTRKEIAAQELEARRRSLARRPSAPTIPLPVDFAARPGMAPRSHTELGDSPTSFQPLMSRSITTDSEYMTRHHHTQSKVTGSSTPTAPIGLPATPRAMRHPRYLGSDASEHDSEPPIPRIPGQFSELSSMGSSLSQATGSALSLASSDQQQSVLSSGQTSVPPEDNDSIGPLLPSTVFGQKPQSLPSRSASAPPENQGTVHPLYKVGLPSSMRRLSGGRGHVRKISPPDVGTQHEEVPVSIDAALYQDQQVIVIPEEDAASQPPILAQLQHLAGPPPPPPPPTMYQHGQMNNSSGVINIAIDGDGSSGNTPDNRDPMAPIPTERAATADPTTHRRNQPSGGSSFFRGFGDRMRSSSKSRTKSPPMGGPAPYETVLQPMHYQSPVRRESMTRAKSPYEQAMAAQSQDKIPIPPPPPPAPMATHEQDASRLNEVSIPPFTLPNRAQSTSGYRHPKEIRANMPPETLQQGVYQGGNGGMI